MAVPEDALESSSRSQASLTPVRVPSEPAAQPIPLPEPCDYGFDVCVVFCAAMLQLSPVPIPLEEQLNALEDCVEDCDEEYQECLKYPDGHLTRAWSNEDRADRFV